MLIDFKSKEKKKMAYPPKSDPTSDTWVIAFDLNLDRLYQYARDPQNVAILRGKTPDVFVRDLRSAMFGEIYNALKPHGFDKRLQNSLVFNNRPDATVAFRAVSRGLAQSWAKYFVERVHLFRVDPNSDASDLLNKDQIIPQSDRPDWFTDELFSFISQDDTDLEVLDGNE